MGDCPASSHPWSTSPVEALRPNHVTMMRRLRTSGRYIVAVAPSVRHLPARLGSNSPILIRREGWGQGQGQQCPYTHPVPSLTYPQSCRVGNTTQPVAIPQARPLVQ